MGVVWGERRVKDVGSHITVNLFCAIWYGHQESHFSIFLLNQVEDMVDMFIYQICSSSSLNFLTDHCRPENFQLWSYPVIFYSTDDKYCKHSRFLFFKCYVIRSRGYLKGKFGKLTYLAIL